ncbi:MAG: site-2 protease family protein [Anaerolineales bacterium]
MDRGIPLLKIRGIQIRMHYTFPLILVFAAVQFALITGRGLTGALFGVVVTSILFVIVVLHELGHSIAAQSYGIQVKQIVLLPIGGLAQLGRMPEKPSQELVISAAGPLVNIALAAVLAVLGLAYGQELGLQFAFRLPAGITLGAVFSYVFAANLFLGLFNLLPAFPMDGGRILRSLLAMRIDYSRATMLAVTIGQGLAVLMGLWGFFGGGGFFLIFIAIFIFGAAGQEGRMAQMRRVLEDVTVREALSTQVRTLSPHTTLREAIAVTLSSIQSHFPVLDGEGLVGVLTSKRLAEALRNADPDDFVAEFMRADLQPVSPDEKLYIAQQLLGEAGVDALPVEENGQFLGLVTAQDVNKVYHLASRWPGFANSRVSIAET